MVRCAVGPWRLGTSPEACRVQAVAARRCSAVLCLTAGHGVGPMVLVTEPDMRSGAINVPAQCPVAGPLRHIRQDSVA